MWRTGWLYTPFDPSHQFGPTSKPSATVVPHPLRHVEEGPTPSRHMRLVVDHHLATAVALDAQEPRREGAQQPNPTSAEEVKIVLAGISRTRGTAPKRNAAVTADVIMAVPTCIPADTLLACGRV
jgi:hypothetical protein